MSLIFEDPAVEAAFTQEHRTRLRVPARICCLTGAVLFALFAALDVLLVPDEFVTLWAIRFLGIIPVLLICGGLTWTKGFDRFGVVMVSAMLLACSAAIVTMIAVLEPPAADYYYAGLMLVVFYNYAIAQLRLVHSLIAGWGTVALYLGVMFLFADRQGAALVNNTFFLISANAVGMGAAWYMERLRREEYHQRRQIEADRAKLVELNEELVQLATRDALTGLLNRRYLAKRLDESVALFQRYQIDASIILVDLDDFKKINDQLGHPMGDAVLQRCGQAIMSAIRGTDMAFRYGGDEFLILLPNTPAPVARSLSQRLERPLAASCGDVLPPDRSLVCSVGVGAVSGGSSAVDVLEKVDQSMYDAKRARKALLH